MEQMEAIQASLESVRSKPMVLAERFFDRLFREHPRFRTVFEGVDAADRERLALSALTLTAEFSRAPGQMERYVRRLAQRHIDYGAKPEDLKPFINTLLVTIAELSGKSWTHQSALAWRRAGERIGTTMAHVISQPSDTAQASHARSV
jgi:nitric oxide dioxygenase